MTAVQQDQLIAIVVVGTAFLAALGIAWTAARDHDWSLLVICLVAMALAAGVLVSAV